MQITKNVFTQSTLEKLHAFTRDGKQPSTTNFFAWQSDIVGISNAIFMFEIDSELKTLVAEELVQKEIWIKEPKRWSANIFLMTRNSFIAWHDDSPHKATCTIYLNKEWDSNWGGYFMYQVEENIKAYKPEYNMAISFLTPLRHCTTLTSINSPFRESLQIFVNEQ